MYLSFVNKGLIDPRAITTLGVSVKEEAFNPIGYFGTGLKYAIAVILRNKGEITIWRGREELKFCTKAVKIRGKLVELVCLNNQELGFTTELGKNWKMWQAFRELYCNAKDEGGFVKPTNTCPEEGTTSVQVYCAEMFQCFTEMDKYFLTSAPKYLGKYVDFHTKTTTGIYYKGILAGSAQEERQFKFAPNITAPLILTEDRTISSIWDVHRLVAQEILTYCEDKEFLSEWLTASHLYTEHFLDLNWNSLVPSPTFLKVAEELAKDYSRPINKTVLPVLARHSKKPEPRAVDIFTSETAILQEAIAFCKALKYPVNEFEIVVTESLGENVLGQADRDFRKIYLSRRAIQSGKLMCASTLIEEWVHIKHGLDDCSQGLQNWLFDQVTILGTELLRRFE